MKPETDLSPEISTALDTLLGEWSAIHQLAPTEVAALREGILSGAEGDSAAWWREHMKFFNELMTRVSATQETVSQMLHQVRVNVQAADSPFTAFAGDSSWQPYLKLS
jgi:uncharacterized protein YgfB (UPF0149 family)